MDLADETATLDLGRLLSKRITHGLIYLQGPLGIGKTTLVRGFLRGLNYQGLVKSPTYTLIEPYEIAGKSIAHIDLYRIESPLELEYIGLDETLADSDLVFIEWPERGTGCLPRADWLIEMVTQAETRKANIHALVD